MSVCRFCKRDEHDHNTLVKYGTRHYAHRRCYLTAGKSLADLHDWQIALFPMQLLKDFGLLHELTAAQARIRQATRRLHDKRRWRDALHWVATDMPPPGRVGATS